MVKNAIILAAGLGTRLKPITDSDPKCLTVVNGTPILLNALGALASAGVKECTIVTGYMAGAVERAVGGFHSGMKVRHVLNALYAETNDMYSLWLARDALEEGALVIEGDVFLRLRLLSEADRAMGPKSYYFAGLYDGRKNEIRIVTSGERGVLSIEVLRGGKSGPTGRNVFFSAGFLAVQPELGARLSRWLSEYAARGEVNVLFDDVLAAHVPESGLFLYEISQRDWVEVDTLQDLQRAEETFR
jgi:CTP:phosphocholine cytidylyltransferase-like protein